MFSLGRKIDINYQSNRWLIIISAMIAGIMAFFQQNIVDGFLIAFAFFLCWALVREIDPQHEKTAFIAGFLFVATTFFIFDGIQFVLLFWLLLALRFISKICGKTPTIFDAIVLIMFSIYLTYDLKTPIIISLVTLMFIAAWYRYNKNYFFLLAGAVAVLTTIILSIIIPWHFSDFFCLTIENYNIMLILLIIFLLYLPFKMLARNKTYYDDLGGKLEYRWLQLTLVFMGLVFINLILFSNITYSTIMLLFANLSGVNLSAIYLMMKNSYD